jgi:hypothetical protein
MHNGLKSALIFMAGATIGSVVTWKVLKTKYEQIVQEEIDSFKAKMAEKHAPVEDGSDEGPGDEPTIDTDREEYARIANMYSNKEGGSDSMEHKSHITVLHPNEFAEDEDYETETLILWSDDILSDDRGNIVEDVKDLIGEDFRDHFGEYEDYSIYIRNDKYKCEYEIVQDLRGYDEVFTTQEKETPDLTDEE